MAQYADCPEFDPLRCPGAESEVANVPTETQSHEARYVLLIGKTAALRDVIAQLGGGCTLLSSGVAKGMRTFAYKDIEYITEAVDLSACSSKLEDWISVQGFHLILFAVDFYDNEGCQRLANRIASFQHHASWISALVLTCGNVKKPPRLFVCEFRAEEQTAKNRVAAFVHKGVLTIGGGNGQDDAALYKLVLESREFISMNRLIIGYHGQTTSASPRQPLRPPSKGQPDRGTPPDVPSRPVPPPRKRQMNRLTVLALGKVGSGKKTIGRQIAGKDIFDSQSRYGRSSMTRGVSAFEGEFERDGVRIRFQTVDTESLEVGYNDPLLVVMSKLDTIDLILFVIPHGRYTDESHASLTHAIDNLSLEASTISALVITHCDGMMQDKRETIVAEFNSDARTRKVSKFMGMKIHTVGFPELDSVPSLAKQVYEEAMAADSKSLRHLVKSRIGQPSVPIEMLGARHARGPINIQPAGPVSIQPSGQGGYTYTRSQSPSLWPAGCNLL